VVTTAFTGQAQYQADMLNLPAVPVAYVRHPLSNNTPKEISAKVEESFDVAVQTIRAGPVEAPAWATGAPQGCSS